MKKIFITTSFLSIVGFTMAQDSNAIGMQNELSQMAKFSTRQTGFESIQSYSSNKVIGSQFYFPSWCIGTVTTSNNEVINNPKYQFIFDKVRQLLFIKQKDTSAILLAEMDHISTFTLISDKPHLFENGAQFGINTKGFFFEVLIKNDSLFSLTKLIKTSFIKSNPNDMLKIKSGENYDEFKDDISYSISYKGGELKKINLNEHSIIKAFSKTPYAKATQDYLMENHEITIDENFLVALINQLNK